MLKLTFALLLAACPAGAQYYLEADAGAAWAQHNTAKVPLDGGTRFSLTDDLKSETAAFGRLRVGRVRGRHDWSLLAAPLTLKSEGTLPKTVIFDGVTFPAGVRTEAVYKFNSYRVRYLYEFRREGALRLRAGGALKMRHAAVELDNGTQASEFKNTGFVPLAAFSADWGFRPGWALLFDFEGLAAPQGRAEDAALAVSRDLKPGLRARAGYRFLEGGSGAGKVYTFAWINYLFAGLTWEF
jgi:hypothetical protein